VTDLATYVPLESDQPTMGDDFDRGALVDRIYHIVTQEEPLGTVGVYGGWGSGKSSIMRQLRRRLEEGWTGPDGQVRPGYFGTGTRYVGMLPGPPRGPIPIPEDYDRERGYRGTVWFSAWEHQKDIDPAVAMLQEARRMLRPSRLNRWRMKKWFRILRNAIGTTGEVLERMGPATAAVGAPLTALRQSVERVSRDLYDVQEDQVRKKEAFTEIVRLLARRNRHRRVVFFVDDLDRCDDDVARRLLDDIKTYLDQPQCVFVIGVNSARLRESRQRASSDQAEQDPGRRSPGEDRLAKIIQYPFYVPMLAVDQYRRYLEQTLRRKFTEGAPADETDETPASRASLEEVQVRSVAGLLTDVLTARSTSLREVKRLVNVFTVNHELASDAFGETGLWGAYQPQVVAVLSAVQAFYPATFEWLSDRSDARARMRHLFTGAPVPRQEQVPPEVLDEMDGTSILAAARKIGSALADETRLSLYLSMWGQTHECTPRENSRWTTEWRARSDLTVGQVQQWIQGVDDDGQHEHRWTEDDLRVVKLGDWWWWVLDVRELEPPSEHYPEGRPLRALLLSEGLVATRPYAGNVDEHDDSDFPTFDQWSSAGPGTLAGALWSESSLRTWLRGDFAGRLPSEVASAVLPEQSSTVTRWARTDGFWAEKATPDSGNKGAAKDPETETIYLLAYEDALADEAPYRLGKADADAHTESGLVGFWWLRSPGHGPYDAWAVLPSSLAAPDDRGSTFWAGGRAGVRPAFWLNLGS